jgi:hypothetical protein
MSPFSIAAFGRCSYIMPICTALQVNVLLCHLQQSGLLPIEIAAFENRRKDVEILFPVTARIPSVHDWNVDGVLAYVKSIPTDQVQVKPCLSH